MQLPLCGYGGVSRLEVGGASSSSTNGQSCLDIGEVKAQRGIKLKVLLYNSGPRAAFVWATCCKLDSSTPLPDSHAHLMPSHMVIPPHSTEQLLLFYRPDQAEETKCRVNKSPLARLLIATGDELVRQRLVWAMGGKGGPGEGQLEGVSSACKEFVKEFSHQEKVISGE